MKLHAGASLLVCLLLAPRLIAQPFSPEERLQGYQLLEDSLAFVLDEQLYGLQPPERVVVTGSFRAWSQDMAEEPWQLTQQPGGYWVLKLPNPGYRIIPPSAEFKFRINEGTWLAPPAEAPNEQGGNLVFLQGVKPPALRAEVRADGTIWATITGTPRPLTSTAYRLTDGQGREIPIAAVLPNTATQTLIQPARPLDKRRIHRLELPQASLKAVCEPDGWFRSLYSSKPLGANVREDGQATTFRLFAPRATSVRLYLYEAATGPAYDTLELAVDADGVWEVTLADNLHGTYYDYTVHGPAEPGNHFFDQTPVHLSDPYARVSLDTWGRCRVWKKTLPATPLEGGIPAMEDVVAYEVHVQDFTDRLPVAEDLKGTLPAMHLPGLTNQHGHPVGFDYLVKLGINVLHLMPVQEFLHYPDSIWAGSFRDDPYMQEQGIHLENYQWGYRTSHAFAVESRFRKKGSEPGAEREQFRDLVQAFHEQGIAVIIDLVPNHTAENMDGNEFFFHFNAIDKLYYYRTRDLAHIGAYGNEVKTEDRPMVQRWLLDQCRHFIEEFGIDGFRIDLAGQIDEQTLRWLREQLGEDIILYGEPWIASNDPRYEAQPDWDWYKADAPITFFQDDARNAFKGPVSNPQRKQTDRGYAGGDASQREQVMKGLMNDFPEDDTYRDGITYLDIHDNWALADRFATENWDGRYGVEEDRMKIAATLLYTTMGPLVTHGGTEMMRSKGVGPLREVVKETHNGWSVYLHGKRDTYNLRTANQFVWENVGLKPEDAPHGHDYAGMYAFWQGLNRLRFSEYGEVFRLQGEKVANHYQWMLPEDPHVLGYVVGERVMVWVNVDDVAHALTGMNVPEGNWRLVANNRGVDLAKGPKDQAAWRKLAGGAAWPEPLPPRSIKLWVRE